MRIDTESFRGKLYLLIIDKLVIGAVIALAFVVYDLRRTADLRRYETQAKDDLRRHETQATSVQLQFERAKLVREFMPVIAGREADVVTRAYVLRSAIAIGALDAEAGVELGRKLLTDGLDDQTFTRVMASTMPTGLPAVARLGEQMAVRLRPISPLISGTFRPESVPFELRGLLREARLWRNVVLEAILSFEGSYKPLESTSELPSILYGLYVLLEPGDSWAAAIDLSHSRSRGISLIGNLRCVFFDSHIIAMEGSPAMQNMGSSRYSQASARVERELLIENASLNGIRNARTIIRILTDYGPPAGPLAVPLARLFVAPGLPASLPESVQGEYRSLQWDAGELLKAMQKNPKNAEGFNGAHDAEPTLLAFLRAFRKSLNQADTAAAVDKLVTRYEGGTRMREVVEFLGGFDSDLAKAELKQLRSEGADKLRHFPFLADEVARATGTR